MHSYSSLSFNGTLRAISSFVLLETFFFHKLHRKLVRPHCFKEENLNAYELSYPFHFVQVKFPVCDWLETSTQDMTKWVLLS